MYIDHHKIHGRHDIHNYVQSLHHFIDGIVGGLPPANHDGAFSNGTLGDLVLELVNNKRYAFVQ